MINLEDLEVLKNKIIYNTTNDEYVLYEKNESVYASVDFRLLGFLNGYSYCYSDGYLVKTTIDQIEIARIYLECEKAVFIEGKSFFYIYTNNILTQVTENLIINWSKEFDDDIRDVTMDNYGDIYILFTHSRIIRKYSVDGEYIYYLNESDDPSKECRLYKTFVSEGCGHLYVIGSEFWDNNVRSFIDHYDTRKCEKLDSNTLCEYTNVAVDDPYFTYKDLYVDGDYVYIYANNYIERLNLKLRSIWKYGFGYNPISGTIDSLVGVVFDDDKFHNRIFFCENFNSTGGYSFGKLNMNGNLLWKVINPENIQKADFNICIYKSDIFIVTKRDVTAKANYVLALDDNRVLFETQDNYLIRIVEHNYEAIYDPQNYIGEYLIGDEIKEGVPKTVTYDWAHDNGLVVTENDEYIQFEEENPDYRNPENYNYFRLIGTGLAEERDATYIQTPDGKFILSHYGSLIETLYPYQPDLINQYITDAHDNILNTDDGKDIIRAGGIYSNTFYVLADRHKFAQDIITKKDEYTIITKNKGYNIIRKAKYVYRYIVKQLVDIDIIVEHLIQEGILNTMIPKYVDRLRHHTTHMIEDMQRALKPTLYNIEPTKRYGFQYDGSDYPLRISRTQMFLCKNIPYIGKRKDHSIFIESMATLVENEEVTPFILFLNGKAVKWSDMTIVRDWYFSYIIISNNADESENLECVIFPCTIRYGEDNEILPDCTTGLYFTNEGYVTHNVDQIAFRIEVIDKDVVGADRYMTAEQPYIEFDDIEFNQLTEDNNILVFEDGAFYGDSRFYLDFVGKNIYTYERPFENVFFKTYYFDKANDSKNMMFDIPVQSAARENIIDKIADEEYKPTDNFLVPFDFRYTSDKTYLRNISEATRYILKYHMQLLIDFYRNQSNITYMILTGEKVLNIAAHRKGFLEMPRQKVDGLHDYIIVFKNDQLYEYYHEIEYCANLFRVPIFSHVVRTDKIEIIHFKKVDNRFSTLMVTSDKKDYISSNLRYDNFMLFGNSYSGKTVYDTFNPENSVQYDINFDYKNSFNEYGRYQDTTIVLEDPYYIGKEINITSKRQFHHMYYNILEERNEFVLEPEFRFCHNKNQYMVFVNGLKLNQDDWDLHVMTNEDPIDALSITTDTYLVPGDRINIFYLPESYEEIIIENHSSTYNDIILDVSQLEYPFDRELFLIFIDGRRVQTERIQNITANRIRILLDVPEYHEVCICKYLKPVEVLFKVFSYSDTWNSAVESLTEKEYEELFTKIENVIPLRKKPKEQR